MSLIDSMDSQDLTARLVSSKRILVLGSSGSGKTTISNQLGRVLNLKTIHLDAHFWKPGWVRTPSPEWRELVSSLIREESWIMDGTYESTLDLRIPAADAIVLIETSRWTCLWRMLSRQATVNDQPDAPVGQKLDRSIFRQRTALSHYANWIRYIWKYPAVTRPFVLDCIRQYGPDKTLVQLEGSKDTQRFFLQLQSAAELGREKN